MDIDSLKSVTSMASKLLISTRASRFDFDNALWQDERPKFDIEKVQLQFDLRNGLLNLLVANNFMYVLSDEYLYRIDLENPSAPSQIPLPLSEGNKVSNCWVHPNGKFFILQINQNQYFHLHQKYTKFKVLPRFRGHFIEHMSFSDKLSEMSTGDFLFVTRDGAVHVAQIKYHEIGTQDKKRDDKYVKQVYKASEKVRGIAFTNNSTQIHLFVGNDILVWDCFDPVQAELARVFRQVPKKVASMIHNELALFYSARLKYYLVVPSSGDVYSNDDEMLMSQTESLDMKTVSISNEPKSFIATEHHLIFLSGTRDSLVIFNKLRPQAPIVKEISSFITSSEILLGIESDFVGNTHWIFTSGGIYELVISNESISVWYNYYRMGNYEQALKLLDESENLKVSLKRNVVLVKQGYDLLQKGEFGLQPPSDNEDLFKLQLKGIQQLAKLQEPFEKVCLMLLNLQESDFEISITSSMLLVEYLKAKFAYVKNLENSKIRSVILSTWIVQLLLRLIQLVQNQLRIDCEIGKLENFVEPIFRNKKNLRKIHADLNVSLENFLRSNYRILDSKTIYEIFTKMDFPDKLISFAEMLEEYDFILQHYIEEENWSGALKALVNLFSKNKERAVDAFQRTSTVLLMNYPQQTVETWLRFPDINYETLLPAILAYNGHVGGTSLGHNPTFDFFRKVIFDKGVKSEVLNTYYLSILITFPCSEKEPQIEDTILKALDYLRKESYSGYLRNESIYDSDFLLRLCLKHVKYSAAILILIEDLHLFDTALNLALDNNLISSAELVLRLFDDYVTEKTEVTKDELPVTSQLIGDKRFDNSIKLQDDYFAIRKKLWMTYARYLINGVCSGKSFDVLDNLMDKKVSDLVIRNSETNPVATITRDLMGKMKATVGLKLKSENLNRVSKYLLHFYENDDRSLSTLSLEDLLPLFPEDVLITSFKDEIVDSLDFYNNRINQLTLEMQESAEIANKLKLQILQSELQMSKGSLYTIIEAGEPCQLCGKLLIDKNFVAFRNCHHCFHKDCTVRYYLQLKGDYRFKKIFQNFKIKSSVSDEKEVDNLLMESCLLCTDSNLNTVDEILLDHEKNRAEIEEWKL